MTDSAKHPRAENAGRRTARSADPVLLADAAALAPAVRKALDDEADRRGLRGVERAQWIAAVAVVLGSGQLNEHLTRQAIVDHERAHPESPRAAHRDLAEPLGVSYQNLEQKFGLNGEAGRELRARGKRAE